MKSVAHMSFSKVYPLYVAKAERKGRTQAEVNRVIHWLTGYDDVRIQQVLDENLTFEQFFEQAPQIHPNASRITGVICGYRVEEIEDPLMRHVRYLDKLVDELAKGKAMEKILRS